jgi:ankyrin repeat protein
MSIRKMGKDKLRYTLRQPKVTRLLSSIFTAYERRLTFLTIKVFLKKINKFFDTKINKLIFKNLDRTPMHLAAENGHASIIELLVDKFKASIYERTKDGSTLMHIASLHGHADCAQMLFKKGVFLHMPNKSGARSIHTAARRGHVGIINTLLQKGEHVDVTTNVS